MTPFNFCYWLMGFFELNEPVEATPFQLLLIAEHLALVSENDRGSSVFCTWLSGYLCAVAAEDCGLSSTQTAKLRSRLMQEFSAVIDNSYPTELMPLLTALHFRK